MSKAAFYLLVLTWVAASAEEREAQGGGFKVDVTKHAVPGMPRDDAQRHRSPYDRGTTYGRNELFHQVTKSDGTEGVMWQEYGNNMVGKPVYITWFSADKETSTTELITAADHNPWLCGATTIGNGNIVYMEAADVNNWASNELMTSWSIGSYDYSDAWMVEYDPVSKKEQGRTPLDTDALDLFDFSEQTAVLRYDSRTDKVAVVVNHLITKRSDGIHHQVGDGFIWDPSTRTWETFPQRLGSHSFQNTLITASDSAGFLGLGFYDGSPSRGIGIFGMSRDGFTAFQTGWAPYQVKCMHGSSAQNPITGESFSKYEEISVDGKTFYKWSNDNQVYGEVAMPGIVETPDDDGLLIFFTGEPPSLDSSTAENHEVVIQMPRNLGWVKVHKDLSQRKVLSQGQSETGGFYGFRGGWTAQSHSGINWLTDFKEKWLAIGKPKSVRLAPNRILLMWEQWHWRHMTEEDCDTMAEPSFVDSCKSIVTAEWYDKTSDGVENIIRTQMMIVDDNVNVVKPMWSWEGGLVTPQGDAPRVVDGCAVIYTGDRNAKEIHRHKVCEDTSCNPDPAAAPPIQDDPCFEPYPEAPYRCTDSVDAGGGRGFGPTIYDGASPNGRPALCHEVPHFCSTTAQYCPLTCGACSEEDNEPVSEEFLEKVAFLNSCTVGSKQYGLPPPCFDAGKAPLWRGGEQMTCEEAKDECDRPAVDEDGKADDMAQRMAESCAKTCGVCSDSYEKPDIVPITTECAAGPSPAPAAPGTGDGGAPTPAPPPPPPLGGDLDIAAVDVASFARLRVGVAAVSVLALFSQSS